MRDDPVLVRQHLARGSTRRALRARRDVAAVEEEQNWRMARSRSKHENMKHEERRRDPSSCFMSSCFTFRRLLPVQRPAPRRRHLVQADLVDALLRARDGELAEVLHEAEVDDSATPAKSRGRRCVLDVASSIR
jgi:hypothetical protein